MKKIFLTFLLLCLSLSLCSCFYTEPHYVVDTPKTTENIKAFYDKVVECEKVIDVVATDVCATWKDASWDYELSTKDVNNKIETAKKSHKENISKINQMDLEIQVLFESAKKEISPSSEYILKKVLTAYTEYKDLILEANEALNPSGYVSVSFLKDNLDRALSNLFVEL